MCQCICTLLAQARETYKDAIQSGRTATLLEEDDKCSDIFCCLLGNLPASTEAVVKMSYVTELSMLPEGVLQFVLPTQLRPRYNPAVQQTVRGVATAAAGAGPVVVPPQPPPQPGIELYM